MLFRTTCRGFAEGDFQGLRLVILRALLLLCAGLSATSSSALTLSFVTITDPSFPGGFQNVTRDTATNLEWLDWSASTSITYNSMLTMLGPGGTYEGWRHATRDEVRGLMSNATLPLQNWPATSTVLDGIQSASIFNGFLGITFQGLGTYDTAAGLGSWAFTASPASSTEQYTARANYTTGGYSNSRGDEFFSKSSVPNVSGAGVGHALVRAVQVPEPTSLSLFLAGLAVAGFSVWKKKRSSEGVTRFARH